MAKYLAPYISRSQYFDNAGLPLANGWIYSYVSGTTDPQDWFSDVDGTPLINPLQLDSSGNNPYEVWLEGGENYTFVTKTEDLSETRWSLDGVEGINDVTTLINNTTPVWIPAVDPAYLSPDSVSIPGNQSDIYHIDRRLRITQPGGAVYGTITDAEVIETSPGVFQTDVTVLLDSGVILNTLTEVAYSIIDSENSPLPPETAILADIASLQSQIDTLNATVAALVTSTANLVSVGTISIWPRSTAITGWAECDGAAISRTTYAALFGIIGTTYGTGDGSTTFNIPNLRGGFVRGWDHGAGVDPGRVFGSYQADATQRIIGYLGVDDRIAGGSPHGATAGCFFSQYPATTTEAIAAGAPNIDTTAEGGDGLAVYAKFDNSLSVGARTSFETRPVNLALLYMIKLT